MNDPWFNPYWGGGLLGSALGVLGGTWGTLAGRSAPRGRNRSLVLGLGWLLLGGSAVSLVAGVVARQVGQPYGVWYALLLCGAIGTAVFGGNLPPVYRAYRAAEQRAMEAQDLD